MKPRRWIATWWQMTATSGALIVAGTSAALAMVGCSSGPTDPQAQAQIRTLVIQRDRALVNADMPILTKIHAADYQLITPDGSVESKSELMSDVSKGNGSHAG